MESKEFNLEQEVRKLKLQNDEFRKLLQQWMEATNPEKDIALVHIFKRTAFSLNTDKTACPMQCLERWPDMGHHPECPTRVEKCDCGSKSFIKDQHSENCYYRR
jgi:hypothetical protein